MASLSTCHLELVVWDGNLVKSCVNLHRIEVSCLRALSADKVISAHGEFGPVNSDSILLRDRPATPASEHSDFGPNDCAANT